MDFTKTIKIRALTVIFLLGGILAIWRVIFPERDINTIGARALPDTGFALGLWLLVCVIAIGVGRLLVQTFFTKNDFSNLEKFVVFAGLGMGVIGIGIALLGFTGLLQPPFIIFWLLLCALTWGADKVSLFRPRFPEELPARAVLFAGGLIFVMTVLQALTPPWDYDGLMYHLEGSRRFLEAGRIYYEPEIWQANGPFLVEMIFSIGLALRTNTFPKLIHLSFAALLILSSHTFSNRFLGRKVAWTTTAILLGIAILPYWASWAYADFAWAFYDFAALYLVALWTDSKNPRFLLIAGLFSGFALGTKYLAASGTLLLLVWILWETRRERASSIVRSTSFFLIPALALGVPWWIKNFLLIGNPVFPFIFPVPGWDAERISLLMTYLKSFGTRQTVWDYLLLPINIYMRHNLFGTFSQEIPSLLFPFSLFYVFQRNNRLLNRIGLYAASMFIFWAAGSQQTRFLLPIFPYLSILTAWVLLSISSIKIQRIILGGLVGSLVLITLIYQGLYLNKVRPLPVLLGLESKDGFLSRNIFIYNSLKFIDTELPPEAKVLTLWNGQSYYCRKCLPDSDQSAWMAITQQNKSMDAIATEISKRGASHVLFSGGDYVWFQNYHNPSGIMDGTLASFSDFVLECGIEIYNDVVFTIYEIKCP